MTIQHMLILPLDTLFYTLPQHLIESMEREGIDIDIFIEHACEIAGRTEKFLPVDQFELCIPWDDLTEHMSGVLEHNTGVSGELIDCSDLVRVAVDIIWFIYQFIFDYIRREIPQAHSLEYAVIERWFNDATVCIELGLSSDSFPW